MKLNIIVTRRTLSRWRARVGCMFENWRINSVFLGGGRLQWMRYLHRPDLPRDLWVFKELTDVRAINGVSAVPKKDGVHLRKLAMAVPTNYLWSDVRARVDHGLGGGGALALLRAP
eukprot:5235341-Pyramimonas_sp.AAC.1